LERAQNGLAKDLVGELDELGLDDVALRVDEEARHRAPLLRRANGLNRIGGRRGSHRDERRPELAHLFLLAGLGHRRRIDRRAPPAADGRHRAPPSAQRRPLQIRLEAPAGQRIAEPQRVALDRPAGQRHPGADALLGLARELRAAVGIEPQQDPLVAEIRMPVHDAVPDAERLDRAAALRSCGVANGGCRDGGDQQRGCAKRVYRCSSIVTLGLKLRSLIMPWMIAS
jgi:hypothetical protein